MWLFSNDEDPSRGDAAAQEALIQRHKDLCSASQEVVLWPLLPTEADKDGFNLLKFYKPFFEEGTGDESVLEERLVWIYCESDLDTHMEIGKMIRVYRGSLHQTYNCM